MKSSFSTSWVSSKQVRKQRKYRYNAPLHTRHKFLSAQLSKELRKKYGKRNLPLKTGDEVLIMRGSFAKKKGKILTVDRIKTRVTVDGITRTKRDGNKVNVFFHPSNLQIHSMKTDDKRRLKRVEVKETSKKETAQEAKKDSKKPTEKQ